MYARDHALIATPIGMVRIDGSADAVDAVTIGVEGDPRVAAASAVAQAADQLLEWFAGGRQRFELRLAPAARPRAGELRQGLIELGYGETLSYGALAVRMASSARAIGQLCARNPLPIIVPCHRVLGAGDALGHYSAGRGPATKAWLLDHERHHCGRTLP